MSPAQIPAVDFRANRQPRHGVSAGAAASVPWPGETMPDAHRIRRSNEADRPAIESIYPQAFPAEDLLPLVRELWAVPEVATSLVAVVDGEISGHVMFTECVVPGATLRAALLGPLAVLPGRQGQGIGSALIRAGLRVLGDTGRDAVYVLGDPAFYGRLGFRPESLVVPPYALPAEWAGAWQSRALAGGRAPAGGTLAPPAPWLKPALWGP